MAEAVLTEGEISARSQDYKYVIHTFLQSLRVQLSQQSLHNLRLHTVLLLHFEVAEHSLGNTVWYPSHSCFYCCTANKHTRAHTTGL
jgi:hypothetical protein